MDALAVIDPAKIIQKSKCHILTHVVEDIRRFGPAITLSTEIFEKFNGVFRLCSTLSNRHAPSKDIGNKMADMHRFKHIASGGWWKEGDQWATSGKLVQHFFNQHDRLQGYLGWMNPHSLRPGKRTFFNGRG